MLSGSWARFAPLAGLLAVALLIVSVIFGSDSIDADDSTAKVIAFWTVNQDDQRLGAIFGALSLVPLVWFLGSLRSTLRRAEGGTGRLSAITFGGGLVLVAFAAVDSALQFAVADSVGDVPANVTQTLSVLYSNFWFGFAVGMALIMLAAALVILRTGVLPAWLGWVALIDRHRRADAGRVLRLPGDGALDRDRERDPVPARVGSGDAGVTPAPSA